MGAFLISSGKPRRGWGDPLLDNQGLTYFHKIIDEHLERMSPKQRTIAQFISTNLEFCAFATAHEIAARTGVNAATVVRFGQALGFKGYPELQQSLRHAYLSSNFAGEVFTKLSKQISPHTIARKALLQDIRNLETLVRTMDEERFLRAAEAINGAQRILVISSGSYSALGHVLVHLLRFMGYRHAELETRGGVHGAIALGLLRAGDVLVTISFWKALREATNALRHAREVGVTGIAITDQLLSPIPHLADHVIAVPTESAGMYQSTTAGMAAVYALIATITALNPDVVKDMRSIEHVYDKLKVYEPPDW